ncbi:MAG: acylphosphatase [Candidatus Omnitrophica bacterium]|nr:acylphosphatase [Candidatus Omnitrophota bacterium]
MQKRNHIFFSGMVQGVGFRFGALSLAKKYNIKGWVKNLNDGRVEIIAEGKNRDLDSFVSDLGIEFEGRVTSCEIVVEEIACSFKDFRIIF